jgi:hypothetical protein
MSTTRILSSITVAVALASTLVAADGDTRIAKWKDDKAAAFVLMFDDGCVSHVKNVIPELTKRGLTGTFYINPGAGQYAANKQVWEKDVPAAGFELANHTLTHKGGATTADIVTEITACNDVIHAVTPAMHWPRLVSWGQPGGVKKEMWGISKEELASALKDNLLIPRPDFGGRGATIAFKSGPDYVAHVDKAIKAGTMECIIFHGVGGDWLAATMPQFIELLDGMEARKDKLWVTGHIPAYQYATERDAATVKVGEKTAKKISLTLSCTADPALYDQPLTLITSVPAAWAACTVTQGKTSSEATAKAGVLMFNALPGSDPIVITTR